MSELKLSINETYSFSELVARLVAMGYQRVDLVVDHGEMAVRGGIVDIYPFNQITPLRLEFLDDLLESIRSFNIVSQRSISSIKETIILSFQPQALLLVRDKDFDIAEDHLLADFKTDDYVVHENYGVGLFAGLIRMRTGKIEGEYYHLKYRGSEEVFVPIEQSKLLHKYSAGERHPQLSSIGDRSWQKAKSKAKSSAKNIAFDLFNLYRQRSLTPGHAFREDSEEQLLMEKDFIYEETRDQLRVIEEVKSDMERSQPMDRLVCGDVGYGKTEIAIRAAFKAAYEGRQVALLAPTTILVDQHYLNLKLRFEQYGLKVEMISRFRSPAENKAIIKKIAAGNVDVVIGTHRLIQKDVIFKNLGLLIIDEEQRFGVEHKEYIKKIKTGVDILTLSATPIPRTLYLSLSGTRDLSILETAPENRHPIKTILSEYDETLIKNALKLELARNGQIFFLHNNIAEIGSIATTLQALVPELKVLIAHGRMPKEVLEKTIISFVNGDADLLLCTTIIENGIDIPRANTIIVNNADHFGLSQLHQIRGRVGRSTLKAYAYFLYDKNKALNPDAEKRLHALKEFAALGVGYRIALRDLEIRGAGNILGAQQSGHVQTIGFTLYCKLLEESIRELKGEKIAKEELFKLPLNQENFIPAEYMDEEALRISFYKRILEATSVGDLSDLEFEMKDRFGRVPPAVKNLITNVRYQLNSRQEI